jgi:general stress protein 26
MIRRGLELRNSGFHRGWKETWSAEIAGQGLIADKERKLMQKDEAKGQGLALVNNARIAMLGTNGDDGYPNIKAMIKADNEGLKRIWFSTNTSSKRVAQLLRDPKACVYFVDFEQWKGLMLVGTVEVLQDAESKERLWTEGDEKYYPLGVTDPDYSVLRFTAEWGNYYHALSNLTFQV